MAFERDAARFKQAKKELLAIADTDLSIFTMLMNDNDTQQLFMQFADDYLDAQHSLEITEGSAATATAVILSIATAFAGSAIAAGNGAAKLTQLGEKLADPIKRLIEVLERARAKKRIKHEGNQRIESRVEVRENTRGILGPNAGSNLAATVTPGGNNQAITGHAFFRFGDGSAIVPEGTTLVLPRNGIAIKDTSGKVLETIDLERLANSGPVAQKRLIKQQLDELGVTHKPTRRQVLSDLSDLQVIKSGEDLPNFTVAPPNFQDKPINIFENSTSVEKPVLLNQLLKPNAGTCSLATCTEFVPRK